jgi:DNA polymerase III delta prime subunit
LQSRCQALDIKPVVELAVKRCYHILKKENVKISDEQKIKFIQLVKRHFPDLRKAINELQKNVIDSELCIANINSDNELLETIYKKLASSKSLEARKYLIENEDRFQGDYDTLLGNFLNFIYGSNVGDDKKKVIIATIADHLYKSAFVVDKEINAFACLVNLENALH